MATTAKKAVKQPTTEKPGKSKKTEKLSKAGKWMREHPKGGMIILDESVLY